MSKEEKTKECEEEETPTEEESPETPTEETPETEEKEEKPVEIKVDFSELEDKLSKELEGLRKLYDEIIANLPKEDKETFPDFETWLKDFYEELQAEQKRRKKYPYPYPYPYPCPPRWRYPYPYGPTPKTKATEELPEGAGIVTESKEDEEKKKIRKEKQKIIEALKDKTKLRETWMKQLVDVTTKEVTGHLRDLMLITKVLPDQPGLKVEVPFVQDFDFDAWGAPPITLTDAGTIWGSKEYSVQEAGRKFAVPDHIIEQLDLNLLEALEEKFEVAAYRSEDKLILDTIVATTDILTLDKSGTGLAFDADWVAEGIRAFEEAGKDVEPGDLVLVLTPAQYEALVKDIAGSLGLSFARPDIIQKGRLTEFMGVEIRVVGKDIMPGSATNEYAVMFFKNRVVFAPKRAIRIESERMPQERRTWLVGTHAAACGVPDPKVCLRITTGEAV